MSKKIGKNNPSVAKNHKKQTELVFSKLKFDDRFQPSFEQFSKNNVVDFKKKNFAIVYAPNGSGKSSLAELIDPTKQKTSGQEFSATYESQVFMQNTNNKTNPFYVISDLYARNIKDRRGEKTQDFILGKDIKLELEIEEKVQANIIDINKYLHDLRKNNFNITAKTDRSRTEEVNGIKKRLLESNSALDGNELLKISQEKEIKIVIDAYDDKKYEFTKKYYNDTKSILENFLNLKTENINKLSSFREIGIQEDAIKMAKKHLIKRCPFDTNQTPHKIIKDIQEKLEENRQRNYNKLDEAIRERIDLFFNYTGEDPFLVRETVISTFETGEKSNITELQKEIKEYAETMTQEILSLAKQKILSSSIIVDIKDLIDLKSKKPNLYEEDELLLQELISSLLGTKVAIVRDKDEHNHIKLKIKDKEIIGVTHSQLPFSTGEKNFISLYFELILAKRSDKKIVVLDDPISSFDSIYKNKIIYAILNLLKDKKVIILTHSLDAIRLVNHQYNNSYVLYIMRNIDSGDNGFIQIIDEEKELIINIPKILKKIKDQKFINDYVCENKQFAVSIVPFLRDYINIKVDNTKATEKRYEKLSKLMHGYESRKINLTKTIHEVTGVIIQESNGTDIVIASGDINSLSIPKKIIKDDNYPLLNRTLLYNLTFLQLRILVEKTLYNKDKSCIEIRKKPPLQKVIERYLSNIEDSEILKWRTSLLSKKTLLNEFNHFEGNMSLFLPSLDISNNSLQKETIEIKKICKEIQNRERL